MSSFLFLQQWASCFAHLTLMVCETGGKWPYSWDFVGCCFQGFFRTSFIILVYFQSDFLCLSSKWHNYTAVLSGTSYIKTDIIRFYLSPNSLRKNMSMQQFKNKYTPIYIYIYIYIYTYTHTLKMVLDTSLLNTQLYKRYVSRVKWSNPRKGIAASPTPQCSSNWKGSLLVALDYGRQLYFTYIPNGSEEIYIGYTCPDDPEGGILGRFLLTH